MNSIFLKVLDDKILVDANFGWLNDCANTNYTENDIYFYHKDHLGSSTQITDMDATVIHHIEYMPSGEQFAEQRSSWGTSYKFNSKELDDETGLYYYGARYYNPTLSIWGSVDPMSDKRPSLSPYNYCQLNPVMRVDPTGALDGDFISESGRYLGNDGIKDGRVYLVKTTQTTANSNKNENPLTTFAGISTSEQDATESFIKTNSGNTEAFQSNNIAYKNSVEIIGDAGARQGMVDEVNRDDGKGSSSNPSNNREFGGNINDCVIKPSTPGDIGNVKVGGGTLTINLLADSPSFHGHASGTYSPMIDFNSRGQSVKTNFWYQSPHPDDIYKAGNHTNYVFGRGNGTVYIYNSRGVQATIPQKYFVNPIK